MNTIEKQPKQQRYKEMKNNHGNEGGKGPNATHKTAQSINTHTGKGGYCMDKVGKSTGTPSIQPNRTKDHE